MTNTLRITVATLAVGTALALTGCAATLSPTTPAAPVATTTNPEQLPTTATPPAPVPAIGATITTDADQKAATDAGLLFWDQFDAAGNYTSSVVFAKDAPLPEPVKAAVASSVTAAHAALIATGIKGAHLTAAQMSASEGIDVDAQNKATRIANLSGRKILVVTPGYGSSDGVTNYGWSWHALASQSAAYPNQAVKTNASRDAFVAGLQVWVAGQPDAGSYDIIVPD